MFQANNNTNFSAYNISPKDLSTTLGKIKSPLRAASQKMFLYDILTDDAPEEIKNEATNLLEQLHTASGSFEKDAIMDNIDTFSQIVKSKERGSSRKTIKSTNSKTNNSDNDSDNDSSTFNFFK